MFKAKVLYNLFKFPRTVLGHLSLFSKRCWTFCQDKQGNYKRTFC